MTASNVVVDSSGWLEYLTQDTKWNLFVPYLEDPGVTVLVPAIVLYEVRKILLFKQLDALADLFVSEAFRRTVAPIDAHVALDGARLSVQYKLSMADAMIYATARYHGMELVTSDAHFSGLPGVTLL